MTGFRFVPIETDTALRFRHIGLDDAGNTLRRIVARETQGYPCRHCLQFARPNETMLLGSFNLPRPRGIYWTPSPIFVHGDGCERYDCARDIPAIVRGSLVSVRAYDAQDQCLYDLGQVCPGQDVDPPLLRALDDRRTDIVNIHTARPGCLLARVERIS